MSVGAIAARPRSPGLIVRSPCIRIELPRETSHQEMRFVAPEEIPPGIHQRRNSYRRHLKRAVVEGAPDLRLRLHDLRHTRAALLTAGGHQPKTLQEHLGHSSIRLTLDRYGHLYPSLTEKLQQGLEAVYEQSRAA